MPVDGTGLLDALYEWARLADEDTRNATAQMEQIRLIADWAVANGVVRNAEPHRIARPGTKLVVAIYKMVLASEASAPPTDVDELARKCSRRASKVFARIYETLPLDRAALLVAQPHWSQFVECVMNIAVHTGRCDQSEARRWAGMLTDSLVSIDEAATNVDKL
jgi:hypothetical protein